MSQQGGPVGFADFLRGAIRAAGYTSPSQFARAVKLDPSVVLRWLNGTQRPTVVSLERVAPALHRTTADLVRAAYPDRVPSRTPTEGEVAEGAALSHEISRLLAVDSPISAREREALIGTLDRMLQPYRQNLSAGQADEDVAESA